MKLLTLILLIFPFFLGPSALAEEIKIGFGNSLRPWVFEQSHKGILLDLARASLEPSGHTVKPMYFPYTRRIKSYKDRDIDVVTDINPVIISDEGLVGYLSVLAYAYENYAVVLSKKNFDIKTMSDLKDLSLLSWQGAANALGTEYADMTNSNSQYMETHNQETQIKMLFSKRVDVIQLDLQIFKYFRKKVGLKGTIDTTKKVSKYPLFGKNYCGFFFRSKSQRDDFNKNFKSLKSTKRYSRIFSKYAE